MFKLISPALDDLAKAVTQLTPSIKSLVDEARQYLRYLQSQPGNLYLVVTQTDGDGMKAHIVLARRQTTDTHTRELTLRVGSAEPQVLTLPGSALRTDTFDCQHGDEVVASLVDVDRFGNRAIVREFRGTALDTIGPVQAGEMGLVVTADDSVPDVDPVPEPTPVDPPAPEPTPVDPPAPEPTPVDPPVPEPTPVDPPDDDQPDETPVEG